jgi:glycosyltransferase involved in cell wall biosynthesis
MRIVYDATYATRGKSGIPRDAKSLIPVFAALNLQKLTVIFFVKDVLPGMKKKKRLQFLWPQIIGSALRDDGSFRSLIPNRIRALMLAIESINLKSTVKAIGLNHSEKINALTSLNIFPQSPTDITLSIALLNYRARLARPNIQKPFKLKEIDADVFIQQQADPIRVDSKIAHVMRLHDILPITHPQFFDSISVQVFSKSFHQMIKYKPFIVMDSKSAASELELKYGLQGRVFVVPPVVSFQDVPVLKKKKQVLIVNTLEPRKRTQNAIAGFLYAKRAKMLDEEWKLVVVGGHGWLQEKLFENLKTNRFGADVTYFDSPTDTIVAQLYDESAILLSMSAAEGFGLPPLEGMLHGCLPVVSRIPVHEENIGNGGIYVDQTDSVSIAEAIKTGVDILDKNGDLIKSSLIKHVKERFSETVVAREWKETLEAIIDLHKKSRNE